MSLFQNISKPMFSQPKAAFVYLFTNMASKSYNDYNKILGHKFYGY